MILFPKCLDRDFIQVLSKASKRVYVQFQARSPISHSTWLPALIIIIIHKTVVHFYAKVLTAYSILIEIQHSSVAQTRNC